MGLRERKKAKTRRLIQQEAFRLFALRGYDATTIDQIAEAAEISPSTFFRYFPTKEDVVIDDDYDPLLMETFIAQPRSLSAVAALRRGMREAFSKIYETDHGELLQRTKLQLEHPALRTRMMSNQRNTTVRLAEAVAERYGLQPSDLAAQVFASAVVGAMWPALERWVASDGKADLPDLLDDCLAVVESGFPLGA
ncbi:acyl-CoA-like ligand-binding transcription factor [Catelliglobosispora koreensis]|uniref:acyl-CoA-like ligand-binding transcription factor n=1 Tax=Catelliglobosispora koreensis TaxID=129052 RepID=UPI00037B9F6B|nr:TetR family transcriptional regulator [Catelliglobosispora koreensis]